MNTLKGRAATLGGFVGAMWLVRVLDMLAPGYGSAAGHGIIPRTWAGLEGIPVAPLIHANFDHLLANTLPFLILGALVLMGGVSEFVFVVLISTLVGGAGTWLFGAHGEHLGASGVVFGFFGYLVFRTAFDRSWRNALITLAVAVGYSSMIGWGLLPAAGISWTLHFFGFLGGFLAARLRYPAERRQRLHVVR